MALVLFSISFFFLFSLFRLFNCSLGLALNAAFCAFNLLYLPSLCTVNHDSLNLMMNKVEIIVDFTFYSVQFLGIIY